MPHKQITTRRIVKPETLDKKDRAAQNVTRKPMTTGKMNKLRKQQGY